MNMMLMNMVQILDAANVNPDSECRGFDFVIRIIKNGLFPVLQIGIPIILVVLGTLDLGKAVISSDDKAVKEAQSKLIKRCIYAVAIFFVVTIVNIIMSLVAGSADSTEVDSNSWANCWNSIE